MLELFEDGAGLGAGAKIHGGVGECGPDAHDLENFGLVGVEQEGVGALGHGNITIMTIIGPRGAKMHGRGESRQTYCLTARDRVAEL